MVKYAKKKGNDGYEEKKSYIYDHDGLPGCLIDGPSVLPVRLYKWNISISSNSGTCCNQALCGI